MTAQFAGLVASDRVQLDSAGVHAAYFRGMSVTAAGKIRAKADGAAEPREFVNGIAFSPLGELLVDAVGPITGYSNGGTPVNSRGAVVALNSPPTGYHQGVPVGAGGVSAAGGAGAGINFVSSRQTVQDTASQSQLIGLPPGIVLGNYLKIWMAVRAADTPGAFVTPAGWTLVFNGTSAGTRTIEIEIVATIVEVVTSVISVDFGAPSNTKVVAIAVQLSGKSATAVEVARNTGTSDTPNLTPSWGAAENMWFAIVASADPSSFSAVPTNYTSAGIITNTSPGCRIAVGYRKLLAASEDPGAFTGGGASTMGSTQAARPA